MNLRQWFGKTLQSGVDRENWISGHKYYMVCMFWPSGNIQGYFNSEVLKPLYDEPQENLYIKNK